jgi:DNA-binding beta-propeller fold protein YncE
MSNRFLPLVPVLILALPVLLPVAESTELRLPGEDAEPVFFAFSAERTLVFDRSSGQASFFEHGKITRSVAIDIPGAVTATWAGEELWLLAAESSEIIQLDPKSGKEIRRIPAPQPSIENSWTYTGLAWDGHYLWVAYSAGWSSRIVQLSPENGEEISSVFAGAAPLGIYSDGTHLWMLCSGGDSQPAVVDQRLISELTTKKVATREFLGQVEVTEPRGLAFDGQSFLTIDAASKTVVTFTPVAKR